MNGSDRRAAWSRFWESGARHSLPGSFRGNYQGAIRAFWAEGFSILGPTDRMLDLGTGNGALPALLFELLPRERWPMIEAVDLAEPRPSWLALWPEARVRFRGGVRMEALPYADAAFDLICSQFAIEYGERRPTVAECARVLAPGGRLAAVLHHAESHFLAVAREELDHLRWLLSDSALEGPLVEALPYAAGRTGAEAEAARARLNAALAALSQRIEQAKVPDLLITAGQTVLAVIETARQAGAAAAAERWSHFRGELEAAALRTKEMIAAALDERGMRLWQECLVEAGIAIEQLVVLKEASGLLLGWGLKARRRD